MCRMKPDARKSVGEVQFSRVKLASFGRPVSSGRRWILTGSSARPRMGSCSACIFTSELPAQEDVKVRGVTP